MSSAPSSSAPPVDEAPSRAEENLNDGIKALKDGSYDEAVGIFERILAARAAVHGDLAPECALVGYYYGQALLYVAQSSQEVFNERDPEQAEEDDTPSDLSLAWEALECARRGFESADPIDHSRLADVHVALGDVASETATFDSAMTEFHKAVEHLNACPEDGSAEDRDGGLQRRFCEVYYKMCLASEFLEDPQQALDYCDRAIAAIQLEITSVDATAAAELNAIEQDLAERRATIQISIQEMAQVKNMMRQIFQQNLPAASETPSDNTPVDLGVVGRGKHRIRLSKIEEEENPPPTPRKRSSAKEEHSTDHDATPSTKKSKKEENNP